MAWPLSCRLNSSRLFLRQLRLPLPWSSSIQNLERQALKVSHSAVQISSAANSGADYLAHLRGRIVDGCAPTIELVAQHLDGAGYWKEAFDKAEEEKTALLDRVHDLEKKKASATLLSSPVVRSPLPGKRKRRREDTPAAIANSRSKRQANSSRASKSPADHDTPRGCGEAIEAGGVSGLFRIFLLSPLLMLSRPYRKAPAAILHSASRLEMPATCPFCNPSFRSPSVPHYLDDGQKLGCQLQVREEPWRRFHRRMVGNSTDLWHHFGSGGAASGTWNKRRKC